MLEVVKLTLELEVPVAKVGKEETVLKYPVLWYPHREVGEVRVSTSERRDK